jgi:PAS domain S-box-containing protein
MSTSVSKQIETQDSTGHWYLLNVKPYRSVEKKFNGAVMSLVDIHATKTALEVAKAAEKNILAARADAIKIIDDNPVPLLVINSNRKIILANKAFYEKFDPTPTPTPTPTLGCTLAELGNGQWNIPALTSVIEQTLSEGIEFKDFEIKHVFPKIGLKVMVLNAKRVQLPGSGVETVLLAIEDYTEKRRNEEDLKASEEKYRNLVASAYDGIMVVRKDASIEFANKQMESMFGYDPGELVNKNYEVLITDRDRPKHSGYQEKYLVNPQSREMGKGLNLFAKRKDGSEFPVDISLSPFKLKSETFVNCVVRDITNLKEIEKERSQILGLEKEARTVAEKANHEKDEFLAMLSHELRTPLTSILAWSQMLRQGKLDPEKAQKAYAVLEQSALAQGQLIDDLLDVSRIQAGKLNLTIQKIDPRKVITAAIESTRSLAASKSIQIETKFDPSVLHIFADPIRLQQVLWNLLTNSIKFSTKDGKILVTLGRKKTPAGELICFQVQDNGKGIKSEFIPIIFERFTQVDSSSTRAYGGLGLGLAILKKLVEMHNGTVEVESPGEGKGATFTICLPAESRQKISSSEAEAEAEAEVEAEVSLRGLRVLLVEDEQNARDAFSLMLRSFGAEVKAVESASAALAIFEEFKPNVLISDIAMPDEDGYSLIRKIRALKSEQRKIPALALTAYAGQSDIQQALLAGFQSHMAKPVDANKLALAIARLAGKIK